MRRTVTCALVAIAVAACGGGPVADDTADDVPGDDVPESCGENEQPAIVGQLYKPASSHDRGFYDQPFSITLSAEAGADVIYTLDGSLPDEANGTRATAPATVAIETTTVLRARAFRAGATPSHTLTITYLFPGDVLDQVASPPGYPNLALPGYPDGAIQTLDYAMDPAIVESDPEAMRAALTAIPSISIVMDRDDLFGAEGIYAAGGSGQNSQWQRAASIELLHPTRPNYQFQADAAIRPHTHVMVKRSFKLLFKKEYGPGTLDSCLFRDAPLHGDTATKEFDSLVLRGGTNRSVHHWCNPDDSTYVEDQWMHDSQLEASGFGARGTYVHLYLDGLYFGLYNAMERPDDSFEAAYFGGDKRAWFSVNHGGYVDGDPTRWEYLTQTLVTRDMEDPASYAELTQYLDVDSFIDYLLINWFAGTTDWPENNWYAGNSNDPPGPVRFFVWDADEVWDGRCQGPGDPTPGHAGAWVKPDFRAGVGSTGLAIADLWHAARRSPDFMARVVARVDALFLGEGPLSEASSRARWDAIAAVVEGAFVAESARWGDSRAEAGERTRTLDNMWRPTSERWRTERLTGNVDRLLDAMRAEGYYP